MRLFTSFLLILFFCLGAVESYSKEYRKKKQNYHSLGAGIGIARLTTDMGDDYNPGTTFYGAYTYTRKALMSTFKLSYNQFVEFEDPVFDYKASIFDVSLRGGIYWNILKKDFYEGVTPYIGAQLGYTIFFYDESISGSSNTGGNSLLNIAPTAGVTIPIGPSIAADIAAEYNLNLQGQAGLNGANVITGTTNYNYFVISAGIKFNI